MARWSQPQFQRRYWCPPWLPLRYQSWKPQLRRNQVVVVVVHQVATATGTIATVSCKVENTATKVRSVASAVVGTSHGVRGPIRRRIQHRLLGIATGMIAMGTHKEDRGAMPTLTAANNVGMDQSGVFRTSVEYDSELG